ERRVDPRQHDYYWQGGRMEMSPADSEADIYWLSENWATVTPIHYDLTNYSMMERMKEWNLES
ncbi:MAG: 5'/3'-nucleotidase SurE, partial [Nitrospinota bacterium]|nr:5'/3'-nucleotidase SurE [Nitrospinota bacterium]